MRVQTTSATVWIPVKTSYTSADRNFVFVLSGQRASNIADLNDVVVVLEEIGPRASETEDLLTGVDATRKDFWEHHAELVLGTFIESDKKTDD